MQQTSWLLRPVMPLMLLAYLLLITAPYTGGSYDYREIRRKRSPYGDLGQTQLGDAKKTSSEYQRKLEDIFIVGNRPGVVIFNDTSQPTFKTTTSATPTNNNNNYNSYNNNVPPGRNPDALLFPDDEYICPERRQGKSYCTEVPNYMEITKLDRVKPEKFAQFKHFFRDDLIQPQTVTQRINSEPLEEYYCASSSHLIYPKSAENKESKWLLLVQTPEHKQGILVEQCDAEDKPCRFEESLPGFYTSRCKQHYVFRTMVVLVNGEMKEEQVKMPNCCKCALRSTKGQPKS
ncbi:protein spaetzle isoform X2 [Eurosta solidaginis]|uniref:protein spaetzle isoform X2 n=1 Tax=Eurosta solidaginis TaxID=178769 RepID=UPI003530F6E7